MSSRFGFTGSTISGKTLNGWSPVRNWQYCVNSTTTGGVFTPPVDTVRMVVQVAPPSVVLRSRPSRTA